MRTSFAPRFLSRLHIPGVKYEDLRVEEILAFSRLFLALTLLFAWLVHLGGGARHYHVGLVLLVAYAGASVALLVRLRWGGKPGPKFVNWAQVNDIGWPTLLCLLAEVPNSAFFVLFLFAMIAAAFRWGFVETVATAFISAMLLVAQTLTAMHPPVILRDLLVPPVEAARLILRCGFLLMAGFLLGFLAETEKELRAEIAFTNRLLSVTNIGNRFATALQNVLVELGRVFRGDSVYEVVTQSSTGRTFRWEIPSLSHPTISVHEVSPEDKACETMSGYPHSFFMRRGHNGSYPIIILDEEGQLAETENRLEMPVQNCESVLVISHEMGRDWKGRFVVLNAKLGRQGEHELRFSQNVLRQLAPALYAVYLVRSFRSRIGATERARVARELHDTTIQSLISIEMQVDVLRRRSEDRDLTSELGRIQELLRHEVLNLRELMQTMRPIDIGPHQFLDFIAELVERFSRDTGISVRFISELQEVTLPPATCRELARVVQEGLVNIRKHSGGQSAVVRFGSQNGVWKLIINDDGNGFPFAGRYTLTELDNLRRGPAVIKERVRAVGGDMVIESTPGHGARLEITIPQKGYESYG